MPLTQNYHSLRRKKPSKEFSPTKSVIRQSLSQRKCSKKHLTWSKIWLVVSTQLKKIVKLEIFPKNQGEHKTCLKPPPKNRVKWLIFTFNFSISSCFCEAMRTSSVSRDSCEAICGTRAPILTKLVSMSLRICSTCRGEKIGQMKHMRILHHLKKIVEKWCKLWNLKNLFWPLC